MIKYSAWLSLGHTWDDDGSKWVAEFAIVILDDMELGKLQTMRRLKRRDLSPFSPRLLENLEEFDQSYTMTRVCAIVLNYFGAEKTENCLQSLLKQSVDSIYLVDNSNDAAEKNQLQAIVREARKTNPDKKVSLQFNNKNYGFGRAINRQIQTLRLQSDTYGYYLLINNDAIAGEEMVSRLKTYLDSHKSVAMVAPVIQSEKGSSSYISYNRWFGFILWRPSKLGFNYLTGCCLLIRASVIRHGHVFDDAFFMYGEDILLSWQMYKKGSAFHSLEDATVYHEGVGSSRTGQLFYEYHVARGHILLAKKMALHGWQIPLFLGGRILYLFPRALLRSLRYGSIEPLMAVVLAWFAIKVPAPRNLVQNPRNHGD